MHCNTLDLLHVKILLASEALDPFHTFLLDVLVILKPSCQRKVCCGRYVKSVLLSQVDIRYLIHYTL